MRNYDVFFVDGRRVTVRAADDLALFRDLAEKTKPHFPRIRKVTRENPREEISQESIKWLEWLWGRAYYDAIYKSL